MTDKTSHDSSERCQLAQGDEDGVYNHTWDKTITEQQTDHVYSSAHSSSRNDANVYDHTNSRNLNYSKLNGDEYGVNLKY